MKDFVYRMKEGKGRRMFYTYPATHDRTLVRLLAGMTSPFLAVVFRIDLTGEAMCYY